MHMISPNIILEVSTNGLEGYITINEANSNEGNSDEVLDLNEIIDKIREIIKYGLDEEKLVSLLTTSGPVYKECIARGVSPIDGKDGYIKYYFDLEKKSKPKIREDGTVDYRELDIINNISAGEVLAELIPPKPGKNGIKVTGETIAYKMGKLPRLKYGKNVKLLDDGKTLVAEKSGLVTIIGGKVVVLDVLKVENVDNNVGNIRFDGTVLVRGNILNGFKVEADGDVQVNGVVEGGYIENTGNVIVKKGIQGYNKLVVKTRGSLSTIFIENSVISSYQSITAEYIMHSEISCRENLTLLGRNGLIVGGICRAGKEIRAKTVGSMMSTNTTLEVGIDPEIRDKYKGITDQIKDYEANIKKIEKTIFLLEKMKKTNGLDMEKDAIYIKLLKTKESLVAEHRELIELRSSFEDKVKNATRGRIIVEDVVFPGVKIVIGNSSMIVRHEMKNSVFYVEEGEIKVRPHWEWFYVYKASWLCEFN